MYIFLSSNSQVQVPFREYQYLCILGFLLKNVIKYIMFVILSHDSTDHLRKVEGHTLRITFLNLNIVSLDVILYTTGGKIIAVYSDNNYKH